MKNIPFRLPVKKYIQKYLTTLYGDTIPAIMETDIGFVVLNTLASRLESQVCRGYNNKEIGFSGQSTITFTVPFHYFYRIKKELSVYTCMLLNRYFENKFEEDLFKYAQAFYASGRARKLAIESVADLAGRSRKDLMEEYNRKNGLPSLQDYSRRSAIIQFASEHNIDIETDITLDALIKIEYRYRKKNEKLFLCRLSSPKNLFNQAVA